MTAWVVATRAGREGMEVKQHKGIASIGANPQDLIRRIRNLNTDLANGLTELALPWYTIKNQNDDDDNTEVIVYDVIGGWFGVEASEFVREVSEITTSNINVRINSPGGSVNDGIAIYNALMMHPAKITVYVDSMAASIASVIAMAGDEIVMMPGSQMMIHDALMYTVGNPAELRADADWLDGQSQNIAGFYAAKAGGSPDEWRTKMIAETWMFAQEAVDLGLADRVYTKSTSDSDPAEEVTDKTTKELLNFRHPLMNRGFVYAGRTDRRCPAPEPVKAQTKSIEDMTDEEFHQYTMDTMYGSDK